MSEELVDESIVYTSGTGAIFKSGVPIGKLRSDKIGSSNRYNVEFYSDFTKLKYVFAETITKIEIPQVEPEIVPIEDKSEELEESKLKILEDELKIIEETNSKFIEENENLTSDINDLNNQISVLNNEIFLQKQKINQFNIDTLELEFLKLNLEHGHKCRKSFFNADGFNVGTEEYKSCVLNGGRTGG